MASAQIPGHVAAAEPKPAATRLGATRRAAARVEAASPGAARPATARGRAAWLAATRLGAAPAGTGRLGAARAGVARAGTGPLGVSRAGVARAGTGPLGVTQAGVARAATGRLAATQVAAARHVAVAQHVPVAQDVAVAQHVARGGRTWRIGTRRHRPEARHLGRFGLLCLTGQPNVTRQPRELVNVPADARTQSSTGAAWAAIALGDQARRPGVRTPQVAMSEVDPRGTLAQPSAVSDHGHPVRWGSNGGHLEQ